MQRSATEVPLMISPGGPQSLAVQVAAQLRDAMADGRLAAGERLPATRALAVSLGVSRTVITSAYAQLFAEGWIEGRHGSGTFVAEGAPGCAGPASGDAQAWPGAADPAGAGLAGTGQADGADAGWAEADDGVINLQPGIPWAAGIDQAAWRRAWRQAGHQLPGGVPPVPGLPGLRQALTRYLRRSRGVRCTADQILITRGVGGSLALLAAGLLQPGDLVGVEEPGYRAAWQVFASRGARVVPCAVDRDGLVVSDLPAGLRMVYTTPAHQYPLGGRLPVPRRQALVAWARAAGALIVEDDYDGEFRYDVAPLPALFGLAPEAVVYLGTTSKTLTPGLSTGWLVAQPWLAARLAETAAGSGERAGEAAQRAVLALIASGDLERHIRRMRHEYARRRAVIVEALTEAAAGRLRGDTAGMHIVLELPPGRAHRVAAAARERGVSVVTLDRYYAGPATRGGLVLGYGGASLGEVTAGCRILAEILRGREPAREGRPGGYPSLAGAPA
ncbi:MAG: PLP-dependent aminotransferase family protein [Gemmatimonadota bacterium]